MQSPATTPGLWNDGGSHVGMVDASDHSLESFEARATSGQLRPTGSNNGVQGGGAAGGAGHAGTSPQMLHEDVVGHALWIFLLKFGIR